AREKHRVGSGRVAARRARWQADPDDPKPAKAVMGKLNKTMDAETFSADAKAQKPLIESDDTKKNGLGTMTHERWEELVKQLIDIGVVDAAKAPAAMNCFVQPEKETRQRRGS